MDVFAGDIVFSKAGRDSDRPFVVLAVLDSQYALLADGRLRRVDKPKKKKIKHLSKSGQVAQTVREKLSEGTKVTNIDLKRVLTEFLNEQNS